MTKPVLQVIIGSTRPGRVGSAVADWIIDRARAQGDFEVQVADLAELNLPIFDEPNHPGWVSTFTSAPGTGARSSAGTRAAQMLKQALRPLRAG